MACLERTLPPAKRNRATENQPRNLHEDGTKGRNVNAITGLRNSEMKSETQHPSAVARLRSALLRLCCASNRFPGGSILHPASTEASLSPRSDPALPHSSAVLHSSRPPHICRPVDLTQPANHSMCLHGAKAQTMHAQAVWKKDRKDWSEAGFEVRSTTDYSWTFF